MPTDRRHRDPSSSLHEAAAAAGLFTTAAEQQRRRRPATAGAPRIPKAKSLAQVLAGSGSHGPLPEDAVRALAEAQQRARDRHSAAPAAAGGHQQQPPAMADLLAMARNEAHAALKLRPVDPNRGSSSSSKSQHTPKPRPKSFTQHRDEPPRPHRDLAELEAARLFSKHLSVSQNASRRNSIMSTYDASASAAQHRLGQPEGFRQRREETHVFTADAAPAAAGPPSAPPAAQEDFMERDAAPGSAASSEPPGLFARRVAELEQRHREQLEVHAALNDALGDAMRIEEAQVMERRARRKAVYAESLALGTRSVHRVDTLGRMYHDIATASIPAHVAVPHLYSGAVQHPPQHLCDHHREQHRQPPTQQQHHHAPFHHQHHQHHQHGTHHAPQANGTAIPAAPKPGPPALAPVPARAPVELVRAPGPVVPYARVVKVARPAALPDASSTPSPSRRARFALDDTSPQPSAPTSTLRRNSFRRSSVSESLTHPGSESTRAPSSQPPLFPVRQSAGSTVYDDVPSVRTSFNHALLGRSSHDSVIREDDFGSSSQVFSRTDSERRVRVVYGDRYERPADIPPTSSSSSNAGSGISEVLSDSAITFRSQSTAAVPFSSSFRRSSSVRRSASGRGASEGAGPSSAQLDALIRRFDTVCTAAERRLNMAVNAATADVAAAPPPPAGFKITSTSTKGAAERKKLVDWMRRAKVRMIALEKRRVAAAERKAQAQLASRKRRLEAAMRRVGKVGLDRAVRDAGIAEDFADDFEGAELDADVTARKAGGGGDIIDDIDVDDDVDFDGDGMGGGEIGDDIVEEDFGVDDSGIGGRGAMDDDIIDEDDEELVFGDDGFMIGADDDDLLEEEGMLDEVDFDDDFDDEGIMDDDDAGVDVLIDRGGIAVDDLDAEDAQLRDPDGLHGAARIVDRRARGAGADNEHQQHGGQQQHASEGFPTYLSATALDEELDEAEDPASPVSPGRGHAFASGTVMRRTVMSPTRPPHAAAAVAAKAEDDAATLVTRSDIASESDMMTPSSQRSSRAGSAAAAQRGAGGSAATASSVLDEVRTVVSRSDRTEYSSRTAADSRGRVSLDSVKDDVVIDAASGGTGTTTSTYDSADLADHSDLESVEPRSDATNRDSESTDAGSTDTGTSLLLSDDEVARRRQRRRRREQEMLRLERIADEKAARRRRVFLTDPQVPTFSELVGDVPMGGFAFRGGTKHGGSSYVGSSLTTSDDDDMRTAKKSTQRLVRGTRSSANATALATTAAAVSKLTADARAAVFPPATKEDSDAAPAEAAVGEGGSMRLLIDQHDQESLPPTPLAHAAASESATLGGNAPVQRGMLRSPLATVKGPRTPRGTLTLPPAEHASTPAGAAAADRLEASPSTSSSGAGRVQSADDGKSNSEKSPGPFLLQEPSPPQSPLPAGDRPRSASITSSSVSSPRRNPLRDSLEAPDMSALGNATGSLAQLMAAAAASAERHRGGRYGDGAPALDSDALAQASDAAASAAQPTPHVKLAEVVARPLDMDADGDVGRPSAKQHQQQPVDGRHDAAMEHAAQTQQRPAVSYVDDAVALARWRAEQVSMLRRLRPGADSSGNEQPSADAATPTTKPSVNAADVPHESAGHLATLEVLLNAFTGQRPSAAKASRGGDDDDDSYDSYDSYDTYTTSESESARDDDDEPGGDASSQPA